MVYADEINPTQEIGEFDDVASVSVDQRELAMAGQLIESLSEPFEPESYHDTYREQVLELIERKAGGEQIVAETTPAPSADKVIDLMAALEASVQAAKGARGRHPTALASVSDIDGADADADADEGQGEEETAPAAKRTARKAPAKKSAAKKAPAKKSSAKKAPAKKVAAARKTA
jgi:DNA end-binding protein Ku